MDKLPKVFANNINHEINNYQNMYRSSINDNKTYTIKDISKKINNIFNDSNHIYKSHVLITLKDDKIDTYVVGKTEVNLLTLDNKLIKISDILNIEKI